MKGKEAICADLFCGAGGASNGLEAAAKEKNITLVLTAINHWDVAISTHKANHPGATHMCENLDNVNPRQVVPGGRLTAMLAGVECTHHSNARGGKPMSDQSRASAWHVTRWAEALHIESILVENVREFLDWGPLDSRGRPMKSRKGETFHAWLGTLRSLGYKVDYQILNAADYGDPTSRPRLFIQARRGRRRINWPEPTHSKSGADTLFGSVKKWRGAREIIDWSLPSRSIYDREKPLSENTMRRILVGLRKFGLKSVIENRGGPVEPWILNQRGGNDGYTRGGPIDGPLPAVTSTSPLGLLEPYLVQMHGTSNASDIDRPVPAVLTNAHSYLTEPYLVQLEHSSQDDRRQRTRAIDSPFPALTSKAHMGLVEPFLTQYHGASYEGGERVSDIDGPLPVVDTSNRFGLVEPYLTQLYGGSDARSLEGPLPSVTSSFEHYGLAQPFLVKYYGNGENVVPLSDPLPAVTSRDRFALVIPQIGIFKIDIRYRMLQPHELAGAMSFVKGYKFSGNRGEQVKQIGNAWAGETSKALCLCILD